MLQINRLKHLFDSSQSISRTLREKFAAVTEIFSGDQQRNSRLAFTSLVYPLLVHDGKVSTAGKAVYRRLLEEYFDLPTADVHLSELAGIDPVSVDEAARILKSSSAEKALQTAEFLIALTVSTGGNTQSVAFVREASLALGMDAETFSAQLRKMYEAEKRKQRLRNSGRGIFAALVIIAVFLLTAKYLQSVIFGVLLACILLPLEKFYERKLSSGSGMIYYLVKCAGLPLVPLKKLSGILARKADEAPVFPAGKVRHKERRIIRQSVVLTFCTALVMVVLISFGISKLTGHYMRDLQTSIRIWEHERLRTTDDGEPVSRSEYAFEKIRDNFESLPVIQSGLDYLQKLINNPEFRDQLTRSIFRRSGGIINFTGGVLGRFISLLCDLLLTVFFALLFLMKFAEYSSSGKGKLTGSEYIVRNFFNGIWLPGVDDSLIAETCRIINGILFRLRIWLKGYLTLILVDSSFYITSFFFLGIPFFLPLGFVAGCGIALPYLGPVISCCLTLLVTVAAGGATGEMLLAVIICYLIYNGIIEQFILYPAVIGDSLGLSTLETIIVVLLGAVFAGIPGMIFALPAASVAKFIIPQIYHGFFLKTDS
ncbi:MAG: AI-2E family transporter [Lentisphaerae bacterium]|nr:AI-2E family transporter [Lentisphaerota bacterium]MBE6389143.1 AI-2E family transporter [Lentisphaerota bacterium]